MTTESVTAALQEILTVQGWKTKKLSLDPGSSLVLAVVNTNEELREIAEQNLKENEGEELVNVDEARALMKGLQDQGFQIRTPRAKFSAR